MQHTKIISYMATLFLIMCVRGQEKPERLSELQFFKITPTLEYGYSRPVFLDMLKHIPKDITELGKFAFEKEHLIWTGASLGVTVLLLPFDQQLIDDSIRLGSGIHFNAGHSYSNIGPFRVIPNDINSAVYYIGNGGTTMLLSGFFYAVGSLGNDYRALNTSSELVEVLLATGVITQAIKRISGRQSPGPAIASEQPGGHWTPFPGIKAYQTHTSNYDAMPSGHLATCMATITVIAANYAEIKWIKPVGYTLMGIMAFEMMSSKVHWASDYPLALFIGYVIGKNAAKRRIKLRETREYGEHGLGGRIKTDFKLGQFSGYQTLGVLFTF